jgi:multiple sugar transport system ATP-binding protein
MAEIELRSVTKRFHGAAAVNNASFTIRDGEFFILVGPSGCGKSTLLNMIVGLESVTEGEILLDGRRIDDVDPKDRNMAMVFQSYALYPHMTARENIAFPLKLAGLARADVEARVAQAAEVLELGGLLDRKPGALSGGQRQRVAMGRAIVREPKVFLLDEPLSNLDARLRVQMRAEIARLQRRLGTTTVYVTHDQTEAMTLGDRVAILRCGEVQQIGTPRELYAHPRNLFVAGFLGAPAMNFLPAHVRGACLELPIGALPIPDSLQPRIAQLEAPLVVGFRPDHLEIAPPGHDAAALRFDAAVELIEWLGADLFVHVDVGLGGFADVSLPEETDLTRRKGNRHTLVARADPSAALCEGDVVSLRLAAARVLIFHAESGENLDR